MRPQPGRLPPYGGRPRHSNFLGGGTITTEQRVIEFHTSFGHPVRTTPQTLTREEAILALALIEEEYLELVDALFPDLRDEMAQSYDEKRTPAERLKGDEEDYVIEVELFKETADDDRTAYAPDLVAVADAVADLDVVVNGCGIRHGLDMQALSREVFSSNMSKLGTDGKPVYMVPGDPTSKIAKGPDFREPDIAGVLGIAAS